MYSEENKSLKISLPEQYRLMLCGANYSTETSTVLLRSSSNTVCSLL